MLINNFVISHNYQITWPGFCSSEIKKIIIKEENYKEMIICLSLLVKKLMSSKAWMGTFNFTTISSLTKLHHQYIYVFFFL